MGAFRRLQVEAWGPSCSRLATSQEGEAHAKGEGGWGGAGGSKAFSSSAGRHCRVQKKLLVVSWEATNAYCAFNVLEVDLLQGVRKSPQERQLDGCLGLWKSSRSRRGPCEAWRLTQTAALQVQPERLQRHLNDSGEAAGWTGGQRGSNSTRHKRCSPVMKSYLQKESGRN